MHLTANYNWLVNEFFARKPFRVHSGALRRLSGAEPPIIKTPLSGAEPPIMTSSDGSFCLPVIVCLCVLHVYLSGAVSLILHLKGGTTYRGQCFPEFYTWNIYLLLSLFLCVCASVRVCLFRSSRVFVLPVYFPKCHIEVVNQSDLPFCHRYTLTNRKL